ncbi:SDR family NAD(P)-dependent oxidoreductase [Streptomyces indonesiensis]
MPAAQHTIVMTGASRGIGRVAAEHIVRRSPDAHLLVVARASSGARLAEELATGGQTVSYVPADLGSLQSVRSAAAEIRDRLERGDLPPLRSFVDNAGMQYTNALTESPDGYEATFAVNVLANHLFVRVLQDHFAPPARIVITVSDTHFGDFRHNMGMVPGPVWHSPDVLARPGAFAKPSARRAGAPRTRRASWPPSTSCTSTRGGFRPGSTPSRTTPVSSPAPASPATPVRSPASPCGACCR